jgi:hypothetical protein
MKLVGYVACMGRWENNTYLYSDNLRVRNHLEYTGVGGIDYKKESVMMFVGLNWLKMASSFKMLSLWKEPSVFFIKSW